MELVLSIGTFLYWILCGYLLLISTYLMFLLIGSFVAPAKPKNDKTKSPPSFAVLIPAYNESTGIKSTLDSIFSTDYPHDKITVYVIADNCIDDTADIARNAGAEVFEREDIQNRGKGQAIDWCLKTHGEALSAFELIAFIDADMNTNTGFFKSMARRFGLSKEIVVQGMYIVNNPSDSWRSALGFISFGIVNHLKPAGRTFYGGSANLSGSGMVFRSSFLREIGWPAKSVAEDVELGKELVFRGHRVAYESNAIVSSDLPTTSQQAQIQQSRWEEGNRFILGKYFPLLLKKFMEKPTFLLLDSILDLLVPPQSLLVVAIAIGALCALFLPNASIYWFLLPSITVLGLVFASLIQLRAPPIVWGYLITAPGFVLWKLLLFVRLLALKTNTNWTRTPRNSELND